MSSRLPVTWNRLPAASQAGTTPASATVLAPLALLLLTLLFGCTAAETAAPAESTAARLPRASSVYPPSSYKVTLVAGEGVFEDVSSKNLIVGMMNGLAVAMPLGGALVNLPLGPGQWSHAHGVNARGQIVGNLNLGSLTAPNVVPAFWPSTTSAPIILKYPGEAVDINDHGLVVGTISRGGFTYGIVWDFSGLVGTQLTVLPPLPGGGRSTSAVAINNDWVIVGMSDSRTGWVPVVWLRSGAGWVPRQVTGGIIGYDIDAGIGIVGVTSNRASFGDPDHAGYFAALGPSLAWAVNDRGVATGDDAGSSPGWPQYTSAFVADRGGAFTVLPMPNNPNGFAWRASYGYGINSCGVVVGTGWAFPGHPYTAQPMVWDPGC